MRAEGSQPGPDGAKKRSQGHAAQDPGRRRTASMGSVAPDDQPFPPSQDTGSKENSKGSWERATGTSLREPGLMGEACGELLLERSEDALQHTCWVETKTVTVTPEDDIPSSQPPRQRFTSEKQAPGHGD